MIKLIYDPITDYVEPDNKIFDYIDFIISYYNDTIVNNNNTVFEIRIGSELMLSAFRVAVKRKLISHENILFVFNDILIPVDVDGRYRITPPDFIFDDILSELLT